MVTGGQRSFELSWGVRRVSEWRCGVGTPAVSLLGVVVLPVCRDVIKLQDTDMTSCMMGNIQ